MLNAWRNALVTLHRKRLDKKQNTCYNAYRGEFMDYTYEIYIEILKQNKILKETLNMVIEILRSMNNEK